MKPETRTACEFALNEAGTVVNAKLRDTWSEHVASGALNEVLLLDYLAARRMASLSTLPRLPAELRPIPRSVATELAARARAVIDEVLQGIESVRHRPIISPADLPEPVTLHDPYQHVRLTCVGSSIVRCDVDERWARAADWGQIEDTLVAAFGQVEPAAAASPVQRWMAELQEIANAFSDHQRG